MEGVEVSKERLEEIKENVTVDIVDLVYYEYLDGSIEHWVKSYTLSEGDYRYLIKQAKRVQALEFYKQDWKLVTGQNKRYRGTVEEAIKDLENECLWDALIKLKALEGEE